MAVQRHSNNKNVIYRSNESDNPSDSLDFSEPIKSEPKYIYTYIKEDGTIMCYNNRKLIPVLPCTCANENGNYKKCPGFKRAKKFRTTESLMKYINARPEGSNHIFGGITDVILESEFDKLETKQPIEDQ